MIHLGRHKNLYIFFALLISFFISVVFTNPSITNAIDDTKQVLVVLKLTDPKDGKTYAASKITITQFDEFGGKGETVNYTELGAKTYHTGDGAEFNINYFIPVTTTPNEKMKACVFRNDGTDICAFLEKPVTSSGKYATSDKFYNTTLKISADQAISDKGTDSGNVDVTVTIAKESTNEDNFGKITVFLVPVPADDATLFSQTTQKDIIGAPSKLSASAQLQFSKVTAKKNYKACLADMSICSLPSEGIYLGNDKTIKLTIDLTQEQAKTVSENDGPPTCTIDGIGWIVCPISNFLAKMADGAFHFISGSFLEIKSQAFDTSNNTYKAWSTMRNIANVLFVIVFLIIVFSQMSGFGITNYGVKKMLPRLIVAAILVNVSYFICQIAIDVSNIVGYSLDGVFKALATSSIGSPDPMTDGDFFLSLVGGILGATGALVFAALSITIPMIIGAVVALMMVVFMLVARQAIVILLVVVAPIAFVTYLLPNTNNLFKQWKKIFTSMLLLFPIVALVFGSSTLAASILNSAFEDSQNPWIGKVIVATINVLPLFAVPVILKKSLNGVGNIGSTLNGLSDKWGKGLGSKYANSDLARYRAQQKANRSDAIKAGAYDEKGRNPFKAFNRFRSNRYGEFNDSEMSGNFGTRRAAIGAGKLSKQDAEMVSDAAALIKIKSNPTDLIKDAQKAFDNAVISGDTTKARAAQSILLTTAPGREALHTSYLKQNVASSFEQNTSLASSLRADINGAGLKGSDVALSTLGYTAGSLSDIQKNPEKYKLTPSEIVTQSEITIATMIQNGSLSSEAAAAILDNDNLKKDLTDAKLDLLKSARDNTVIGTALNAKTWQDVETKVNENNTKAQDGNTFTDGSGI